MKSSMPTSYASVDERVFNFCLRDELKVEPWPNLATRPECDRKYS